MKNLFPMKSSNCSILLSRLQTSKAYSRIGYLSHDVFVVVVAKRSAQFVVVHVRFALAFSPASSNLVWINQLELAIRTFPADTVDVAAVRQQFE